MEACSWGFIFWKKNRSSEEMSGSLLRALGSLDNMSAISAKTATKIGRKNSVGGAAVRPHTSGVTVGTVHLTTLIALGMVTARSSPLTSMSMAAPSGVSASSSSQCSPTSGPLCRHSRGSRGRTTSNQSNSGQLWRTLLGK